MQGHADSHLKGSDPLVNPRSRLSKRSPLGKSLQRFGSRRYGPSAEHSQLKQLLDSEQSQRYRRNTLSRKIGASIRAFKRYEPKDACVRACGLLKNILKTAAKIILKILKNNP